MITSVKVNGAVKLLDQWEQAPEHTAAKSRAGLLGSLRMIEAAAKSNTPTASSELRNSIGHAVMSLGPDNILGAVGSPLDYAVPVELGSKPHRPPIQPLRDWVESKLHIHKSGSEAVAQAIARKIHLHGTEGKYMLRDAMNDNKNAVERVFNEAVNALVAELGAQ